MSSEWFFKSFLFSGYFRSVGLRVVSIVSGGCNQSFSEFFYVFFESYRCVNGVFNASKSSPPSFLDVYSLSTSSLGCNAICMVISFLVLYSTCLNYSLVHFKNGPEYLTRCTAEVFIPLISFLWYSFVSSSFLVLLWYSSLIFFFLLHLFDGISFQVAQVFVNFLFSDISNFLFIW